MDIIIKEQLDRIEKLALGNKRVLTFEEASRYTGFSESYLYKLTSARKIPFSKPNGKVLYFDRDKLDNWLLQNPRMCTDEIEEQASKYLLKRSRK